MALWSIRLYRGPDHSVRDWVDQQAVDVQEEFDETLRFLAEEDEDWNDMSYYRELEERGDWCGGFGEILFSTPAYPHKARS